MTGPAGTRPPVARGWADGDRGSAPGELVVLAGLSFVFIAAIIFAGRVNIGSMHVEGATRVAARTLSIARDPESVRLEARTEAEEAVGLGTALCRSMELEDRLTESAETGLVYVTVEITCEVDLAQASLVGVPGSLTIRSSATEVVDRYREDPNANEEGTGIGGIGGPE